MLWQPSLLGSPASCQPRWMSHWPQSSLGGAWPGQGAQALPGPRPSASACAQSWGSGLPEPSGEAAVPYGCTQAAAGAFRACLAAALGQQSPTVCWASRSIGTHLGCRGFRALPGHDPLLGLSGVLRRAAQQRQCLAS